jgi:hypothetical protein
MAVIEYKIIVDRPNGNANVLCLIPAFGGGGPDKIRFSSNQDDTAIEFVLDESPFNPEDKAAPKTGETFDVGRDKGPFEVTRPLSQSIRFNCGHRVNGTFTPWGGSGFGTPPNKG